MKMTVLITLLGVISLVFMTGWVESYSSQSSHVYHNSQPSTSQGFQALGELAYQSGKKIASRQDYNDGMNVLGATGVLMDLTK